jgi:predicted nucleotidyltransferase
MESDAPLYGLKTSVIERMNAVFASFPEVAQVMLYGSRAKGDFRPGSDIDLCLLGDGLTMPMLLKIDTELDDLLLPYKIDLAIRGHIDNPALLAHIDRVGACFYRRAR